MTRGTHPARSTVLCRSERVDIPTGQLHALMRLLVAEGHMTPLAVREIEKVIGKETDE